MLEGPWDGAEDGQRGHEARRAAAMVAIVSGMERRSCGERARGTPQCAGPDDGVEHEAVDELEGSARGHVACLRERLGG